MKKTILTACAVAGLMFGSYAQISEGGLPTSFAKVELGATSPYDLAYQVISLGTPDMSTIEAEDATKDGRFDNYRVAVNVDLTASILSNGTWMRSSHPR